MISKLPSKLLLTCLATTLLFSCAPPVTFNKPQPSDTNELTKFPKRLQGHYQSLSDNSLLHLTDKMITRVYDFDYRFHLNQLDSSNRITGDTLINLETNERDLLIREGDTLVQHIHYTDTLFLISETNVLKKFKGYYFLNLRYTEDNWQVKQLALHKGQLSIGTISTQQDINQLKEISESASDSLPYQFQPTKKQFKKFVKANGFSETEAFVKTN
jgi:hypothetical protein